MYTYVHVLSRLYCQLVYKCIAELNGLCVNIYSDHSKNVQINKCKIFQFKWINFSSCLAFTPCPYPPLQHTHTLTGSVSISIGRRKIAGKSLQLKFCTEIFISIVPRWMCSWNAKCLLNDSDNDNWKLINWQTVWQKANDRVEQPLNVVKKIKSDIQTN